MNKDRNTNLWGAILIALGVVFLLANWGLFDAVSRFVWAILFVGGAAAFLYAYQSDRQRWWALIPGFALLALGLATAFGGVAGALTGSLFLGFIGLGFAAVYFANRQQWWAIIPAGVLLTLAAVAALPGASAGPILFLGIAFTFVVVYLAPAGGQRMTWALYPALGALVLAALSAHLLAPAFSVLFPLALIALGGYLLWQRGSAQSAGGH